MSIMRDRRLATEASNFIHFIEHLKDYKKALGEIVAATDKHDAAQEAAGAARQEADAAMAAVREAEAEVERQKLVAREMHEAARQHRQEVDAAMEALGQARKQFEAERQVHLEDIAKRERTAKSRLDDAEAHQRSLTAMKGRLTKWDMELGARAAELGQREEKLAKAERDFGERMSRLRELTGA